MGCVMCRYDTRNGRAASYTSDRVSDSEAEARRLRQWAEKNILDLSGKNEKQRKGRKWSFRARNDMNQNSENVQNEVQLHSNRAKRRVLNHQKSTYDEVHELVLSEFAEPDVKRGLIGLRNLGNTCFMSTALQCLSNCIPLTDYFLGYNFKKEINLINPRGHKGDIATAYGQIISDMWEESESGLLSPIDFKAVIGSVMPQFQGYAQHDVHEFLAFLLDAIHEDLNRVNMFDSKINASFELESPTVEQANVKKKRKGNLEEQESAAREAWKGYLLHNKSIIVDLFQGQLRSSLQCHRCSHKSITFDPFMYLSVPVPHAEGVTEDPSLEQCIELFCEEEELTGLNGWLCPKCSIRTDATKKLDLWKMPPVLIIHLKRFESGGGVAGALGMGLGSGSGSGGGPPKSRCKLNNLVKFPLERMNLDWCVYSPQRDIPDYDLFAVANHHGSLWGGHYTAFTKNRLSGEWNHFDDANVRRVDATSVVSAAAYVLMYNKMETFTSPHSTDKTSKGSQKSLVEECGSNTIAVDSVDICASLNESAANELSPDRTRKAGLVRRQSFSKPHLWPHIVHLTPPDLCMKPTSEMEDSA